MDNFNVYFGYIGFDDIPCGKDRPIVIINNYGNTYTVFEILGIYSHKNKFNNEFYKKQFYKIKDLKIAGLIKRSYIKISRIYNFTKKEIAISKYLGKLSDRDIEGLLQKINEFNDSNYKK
jgi:hypothetical protein